MSEFLDVSHAKHLKIEPRGAGEKEWLRLEDGSEVLFKYSEIEQDGTPAKYAHAEKLASTLGEYLGVNCHRTELAKRNGRDGCICYNFLQPDEEFMDGHTIMENTLNHLKNLDTFKKKNDIRIEQVEDKIPLIFKSLALTLKSMNIDKENSDDIKTDFLKMIVFDCLIGNNDRHSENWGIIINNQSNKARFVPLFDNECSFGFNYSNKSVDKALQDTNSFDTFNKKTLKMRMRPPGSKYWSPYTEVVDYLVENSSKAHGIMQDMVGKLTDEKIDGFINSFDDTLPGNYKKLAQKVITTRRDYMARALERRTGPTKSPQGNSSLFRSAYDKGGDKEIPTR